MFSSTRADFFRYIAHLFYQLDLIALVDIILVTAAVYYLLMLARGTRAMQLFKGLAILLVVMKVAQWLALDTLQWILGQALFASAVVLVILFQPELRAALDQIGRGHLEILGLQFGQEKNTENAQMVSEITQAVEQMAANRVGALIVIERESGLDDIATTGKKLNATLSSDLLNTIFFYGSPLHDGAVIVKKKRLRAAACILPLSQEQDLPRTVGTRHRAALGLSEESDAIVVVVSEETGNVSLAVEGTMNSILQPRLLASELLSLLGHHEGTTRLRPFARNVRKAAREIPKTTWGTLRNTIRSIYQRSEPQ